MLPGIGGSELIIIAIVALVVVGPKDLPKLLRQLGRFVGKMRSMADDFRASFDDMARQSELDEVRKEVEALRSTNPASNVLSDVNNQMRAIDSDIKDSVSRLDAPISISDPQLDGLPPKWDSTVAPDNAPPSVLTDAVVADASSDIVVKKLRARKPKPEAVPEPVPVPAPSLEKDVVVEPAVTPKRKPRKTVS